MGLVMVRLGEGPYRPDGLFRFIEESAVEMGHSCGDGPLYLSQF